MQEKLGKKILSSSQISKLQGAFFKAQEEIMIEGVRMDANRKNFEDEIDTNPSDDSSSLTSTEILDNITTSTTKTEELEHSDGESDISLMETNITPPGDFTARLILNSSLVRKISYNAFV